VNAAEAGDIETLPVDEKYKALLRISVKLTQHAYKIMDEDIEALRAEGLTDDEILEGVFVACQFNAVDRLADTFGLYELMQLREQ
jgi:alkylhydroperoxidase family enzyme